MKCLITDNAKNKVFIYQLDFIQAFIQSEAKERMFVILDKEYEQNLSKVSRALRKTTKALKNLYVANFSGKSWYEALGSFLTSNLYFGRSWAEGCLYILREGNHKIKLINYVDDVLYNSNNAGFRLKFEQNYSKRDLIYHYWIKENSIWDENQTIR